MTVHRCLVANKKSAIVAEETERRLVESNVQGGNSLHNEGSHLWHAARFSTSVCRQLCLACQAAIDCEFELRSGQQTRRE